MPSEPAAYFLTFTTYGERLHGDPRGTVDRVSGRLVSDNPARESYERNRLRDGPVRLDELSRIVAADAIRGVCLHRNWALLALNVRSNHVHVAVAAAEVRPEIVMNTLKAWATRELRKRANWPPDGKVWTRHGSTRYLWTEQDVVDVVAYILDGQGVDLGGVRVTPEPED